MTKSLRKFLMSLGFATYLTLGAGAMAGQVENWLSPVCYHDSPEYGHYRWNCLLPPPPVASEIPVEGLPSSSTTESLPAYAAMPDDGNAPAPGIISTTDVNTTFASVSNENFGSTTVEAPVYFSATDVRRRDWWTPTFVLSDNRPVTPPVVEGSCQTEWLKAEAMSQGELSSNDISIEVAPTEVSSPRLPPECMLELLSIEFALIQDSNKILREVNLSKMSGYLAASLSEVGRWTVPSSGTVESPELVSPELVAQEPIAVNTEGVSEIVPESDLALEGFSTAMNQVTEQDDSIELGDQEFRSDAPGFMAYTCMIPYALNASTEEESVSYSHIENADQQTAAVGDEAELATAMQGLARQLDWVGLNILRVADHLDSWANQALIRNRSSNVR